MSCIVYLSEERRVSGMRLPCVGLVCLYVVFSVASVVRARRASVIVFLSFVWRASAVCLE